jgi:DNA topoisomerase-1
VTLRKGPYGFYVQLGESEPEPPKVKGKKKEKAPKPKRASLLKGTDPAAVDLKMALALLALPRDIGIDPETGDMIRAGIGRFGPYIQRGGTYVSLKEDDVLAIGINRAVSLLADKPKRPAPKELGNHPDNGKPIMIKVGRFGPFLQHGMTRANLPKGTDADSLTMERAVELLAAKAGRSGAKGKKASAKAKAAAVEAEGAKQPVAEKPAAKKPAARKKRAKAPAADA